jgi:hypothetical protein
MLERDSHRPNRASDPVRRIFAQDLEVVFGFRRVTLQKDVCVHVDEAGQDRSISELDELGAPRNIPAHSLDFLTANEDDRLLDHLSTADIEHAGGSDGDRTVLREG